MTHNDSETRITELTQALFDCRFQMAAVKVEFGAHIAKTRPSLMASFEKARLDANRLMNKYKVQDHGTTTTEQKGVE